MNKSSTQSSLDPVFNSVTLRRLRGVGTHQIEIPSNVLIKKPNTLTLSQLRFIQDATALPNTEKISFLIDIDEKNPNTLVIRKFEDEKIVDSGVLYDTKFNKPDGGAVLYISPTFTLPNEINDLYTYILENPSKLFVVDATESTSITLPTFKTTGEDDLKQIRISNVSLFPITIVHKAGIVVEMFHERISLSWSQRGGEYSWNYIP
jgi:hypothetical protein